MKVKRKKVVFIVLGIFGVCLMVYLLMLFSVLKNWNSTNFAYYKDINYYKEIKSRTSYWSTKKIDLKDIFKFEWDSAYIPKSSGFSGQELATRIDIKSDISPLDEDYYNNRIIFIFKNKIVYDFYYDTSFLKFSPLDKFITKDNAVCMGRNSFGFFNSTIVMNISSPQENRRR